MRDFEFHRRRPFLIYRSPLRG